jgi:hypothetical protein
MEFIKSQGREIQKGAWWAQVVSGGRERESFSSPDAFKTYTNLWERRSQVIPIQ